MNQHDYVNQILDNDKEVAALLETQQNIEIEHWFDEMEDKLHMKTTIYFQDCAFDIHMSDRHNYLDSLNTLYIDDEADSVFKEVYSIDGAYLKQMSTILKLQWDLANNLSVDLSNEDLSVVAQAMHSVANNMKSMYPSLRERIERSNDLEHECEPDKYEFEQSKQLADEIFETQKPSIIVNFDDSLDKLQLAMTFTFQNQEYEVSLSDQHDFLEPDEIYIDDEADTLIKYIFYLNDAPTHNSLVALQDEHDTANKMNIDDLATLVCLVQNAVSHLNHAFPTIRQDMDNNPDPNRYITRFGFNN